MMRNFVEKLRPARGLGTGHSAGLSAALLAATLLAGCGQKGPLWVPGHSKNTPWPMKPAGSDDNTPAADADQPAPAATSAVPNAPRTTGATATTAPPAGSAPEPAKGGP